jgi:putative nucleotidyltransferase with HDIG domain
MGATQTTLVRVSKPAIMTRLQPFPPVAARLMSLVSSDDVLFRRIADLIRSDTAFSAEVLKLANSPLMGCQRKVYSILHAVALLGLDRLKSLVMMVALRNFLSTTLQVPVLLRCWRHSLATAFIAEEIASACWIDKDQGYTAGLLHDMGRLVMLATYPDDYARMLEIVDANDCDLLECERGMFEMDHCEIGRWLAEEWSFPPELMEIAGGHHQPSAEGRFGLFGVVQVSCRLADTLGFQSAGAAPLVSLEDIRQELPEAAWPRLLPESEWLMHIAGKINALECSLMC